jgi:hypothetical protein
LRHPDKGHGVQGHPTDQVGSLILNFAGTNAGHGPNFVPFRTILPYLLGFKGWIIAGINLVGNIALLVADRISGSAGLPEDHLEAIPRASASWPVLSIEVMQTVFVWGSSISTIVS